MQMRQDQEATTNKRFITDNRMVTNILATTLAGLVAITFAVGAQGDTPLTVAILSVAAGFVLVSLLLSIRGNTLPGRVAVPFILTLATAFIAYTRGGLYHIAMAGFPVVIILAGLLLGIRGSISFAALASVAAMIIGYADINGISPFSSTSRAGYDDVVVAITLNFTTAIVLRIIILRLSQSLTESQQYGTLQEQANRELTSLQRELEERVMERTAELDRRASQLQAITRLSESIAQLQDIDRLFAEAARLISEQFGFYHVGIFTINSERTAAVLQASNSEGGQRMLERGHRLQLGSGVVGYAAQSGHPRIALDVGSDAAYFDNPDLPDTRSEAAIPLSSRGSVFGVLDIQSLEKGAFTTDDLKVLQTLANQVSIAFENTRLLTETRTALEQTQQVYEEFTRTAWSRAISSMEQPGFRFRNGRIEIVDTEMNSPEIVSAVESGQVVREQSDRSNGKRPVVAVPVKLRGEVIGILHVESGDPSRGWREDEVSLMEAVAERAAFAMENARLFQDARRRAAKEQLISEASARIGGALNIENILQTTAEELERVLGGAEVLIQFDTKEKR